MRIWYGDYMLGAGFHVAEVITTIVTTGSNVEMVTYKNLNSKFGT